MFSLITYIYLIHCIDTSYAYSGGHQHQEPTSTLDRLAQCQLLAQKPPCLHHGRPCNHWQWSPCRGGPNDLPRNTTLCGTSCPYVCGQPEPELCTDLCVLNICQCAPGYLRRLSDCACVHDCETIDTCQTIQPDGQCRGGANDHVTTCGTFCPWICGQPEPELCIDLCVANVCQCDPGYSRRLSDCACVQDC